MATVSPRALLGQGVPCDAGVSSRLSSGAAAQARAVVAECSLGLSLAGKTGTQRRILALELGEAVMQWLDRLVFYTAE